jgi:hypothetical protein
MPGVKRKRSKQQKLHEVNVLSRKMFSTIFTNTEPNHNLGDHANSKLIKEVQFVARCDRLCHEGIQHFYDVEMQRIKHLEASILKMLPLDDQEFQAKLNLAAREQIQIMHNAYVGAKNVFRQQTVLFTSMLHDRVQSLSRHDMNVHPNLLRNIPTCVARIVYSFLPIGWRFEPIILHVDGKRYRCKFDDGYFYTYTDKKMTAAHLKFELEDLVEWFHQHEAQFHWFSYGEKFDAFPDFVPKEKKRIARRLRASDTTFREALELLASKPRVPPTSRCLRTMGPNSGVLVRKLNTAQERHNER